jgi:hypothetical protein
MTKLRNLKTVHKELILSVYMQLISLKKLKNYCTSNYVTCKIICYFNDVSKEMKGPAICACVIFAFGAEANICFVEPPWLFRRISRQWAVHLCLLTNFQDSYGLNKREVNWIICTEFAVSKRTLPNRRRNCFLYLLLFIIYYYYYIIFNAEPSLWRMLYPEYNT